MPSEARFDERGNFEGFTPSGCEEHRTVGTYRAWCFTDSTWCYPEIPCPGCAAPTILEKLTSVREAVVLVLVPGVPHDCRGPQCIICAGLSDALEKLDEIWRLIQ